MPRVTRAVIVAPLRHPASPSTNCGSRAGREIPSHRAAHQRSLRETPGGSAGTLLRLRRSCQNGMPVKHHVAEVNGNSTDLVLNHCDVDVNDTVVDVDESSVNANVAVVGLNAGRMDEYITDLSLLVGRVSGLFTDMKRHIGHRPLPP